MEKILYYIRKLWNFTKNYATLIYYGKQYGSMGKKLWYYCKLYYSIFVRTKQISTLHLWLKGIIIQRNEGSISFPMGDYNVIAKRD